MATAARIFLLSFWPRSPLTCTSSMRLVEPARRWIVSTSAGCVRSAHGQTRSQSTTPSRETAIATQSCSRTGNSKFTYNVAASYVAKGLRYDPSTHTSQFSPYNRVQPPRRPGKASRPESGHDAFFVSRIGDTTSGVAIGVADGVGGWVESGVDPADFSHAFCHYMAAAAHEYRGGGTPKLTARQVMEEGYEAVCLDPAIAAGGSTAVVGLLGDDGMLEVANLGDSGFILLRSNAVYAASPAQTHAFNTPFQLSVVPEEVLRRAAHFGGRQLMDDPGDADVTRHRLRHGDVLVFASDGVWDNLFDQDILRIVSATMTRAGAWSVGSDGLRVAEDLSPNWKIDTGISGCGAHGKMPLTATLQSLVVMEIVNAAKLASMNRNLDGPFAKAVKKEYPHDVWHGGKEDDVCVVAVVVSEEDAGATTKSKI